jgi:hypothetical protein
MPLRQLLESDLLRVARERIDAGQLPSTVPDRVWGSPKGNGQLCALCDKAVAPHQALLELDGQSAVQFHVVCHAVWELECRARQLRGATQWTSAEPPRV